MYDPSTARFVSEDPIGFEGGTPNLYEYVENNPITATDPTGTRSYELTQLLLNYSHPREGQRSVHIYNTTFPDYYPAFITANNWYLMITEPQDRFNSDLGGSPIPWVTNAPLKTSTEGEGGRAIFRPIGTGGKKGQNSEVPTIQLKKDKRGNHNTPGRERVGRIKFEWEDDDKSCPFIPLPVFSRDGLNVGDQPGFGANPVPSGRRIPDIDIPIPIPIPVPIPFPFPKY